MAPEAGAEPALVDDDAIDGVRAERPDEPAQADRRKDGRARQPERVLARRSALDVDVGEGLPDADADDGVERGGHVGRDRQRRVGRAGGPADRERVALLRALLAGRRVAGERFAEDDALAQLGPRRTAGEAAHDDGPREDGRGPEGDLHPGRPAGLDLDADGLGLVAHERDREAVRTGEEVREGEPSVDRRGGAGGFRVGAGGEHDVGAGERGARLGIDDAAPEVARARRGLGVEEEDVRARREAGEVEPGPPQDTGERGLDRDAVGAAERRAPADEGGLEGDLDARLVDERGEGVRQRGADGGERHPLGRPRVGVPRRLGMKRRGAPQADGQEERQAEPPCPAGSAGAAGEASGDLRVTG